MAATRIATMSKQAATISDARDRDLRFMESDPVMLEVSRMPASPSNG
jgi:hypothetical protein